MEGLAPIPAATFFRNSELKDRAYGIFFLLSHKKTTFSAELPQPSMHPTSRCARPFVPVKPIDILLKAGTPVLCFIINGGAN